MLNTLFCLSIIVFVGGLLIALLFWLHNPHLRAKNHAGIKPPWIAAISIFISVLLYSIVESFGGVIVAKEPLTQALLLTLETFTFARDVSTSGKSLSELGICINSAVFYGLGNTLYIAASITTLGTIISLASKRLVLRTLWFTTMLRETYVFSRANDQAITLAISIREDNLRKRSLKNRLGITTKVPRKCQIIFADANLENDRILEKIRNEGFKYIDTVTSAVVTRCRCRWRTHLHIILASNIEIENLHEGIELSKTLNRMLIRTRLRRRLRSQPTLHVFASSSAAESYVDRMVRKATKKVGDTELPRFLARIPVLRNHIPTRMYRPDRRPKIRRIDWTRNVVQQMLVDYPLFLTAALPNSESEAQNQTYNLYTHPNRRIVIVGAGNMGYAFLKAVLWCGQSLEVETFIDVVDKDAAKIEQRLKTEAPGLFEATDGHVYFRFLSYEVNSATYLSYLEDPTHEQKNYYCPASAVNIDPSEARISYMLFALDDDLLNTEAAKRTREVLESCRLRNNTDVRPFIAVVIDDHELANSILDIENSKSQSYDLVPVGNEEIVFSYSNLFCPMLEEMGERLNFAYWGGYGPYASDEDRHTLWEDAEASYDKFEYNRRSSRASAAFLKYDLYEFCRQESSAPRIDVRKWTRPRADTDDNNAHRKTEALGMQGPDFDDLLDAYDDAVKDSDATSPLLRSLMELEHLRWNAYMRTEGFQSCTKEVYERVFRETKRDQHQLANLHICIAPYDELPTIDLWDAETQKRALTTKARRLGFESLVDAVCRPDSHIDTSVVSAIQTAIVANVGEEDRLTVREGNAIEWYNMLKTGSDSDKEKRTAIADSSINWVCEKAAVGEEPFVSLQAVLIKCAEDVIDTNKHKKPFEQNDLAIIQNLRSIVRGG